MSPLHSRQSGLKPGVCLLSVVGAIQQGVDSGFLTPKSPDMNKETPGAKAPTVKEALSKASTDNCISFHADASILFDIPPLASPTPIREGQAQATQLLEVLHPGGGRVCITSDLCRIHLVTVPGGEIPCYSSTKGIYFKVNRVVSDRPSGSGGGITDADCGHDLVMLEMDDAKITAQTAFWSAAVAMGFPLLSLTSSGGKSLHAIVRVNAADADSYAAVADALLRLLEPLGPDSTSTNNSRYTRLPGCTRGEKNTLQRLLYLNPSAEVWSPEHPANAPIEAICAGLPPLPGEGKPKLVRKDNGPSDKMTPTEKKGYNHWAKEFSFFGRLDMEELLANLGWATDTPFRSGNTAKFFLRCPWADGHTGGGMADGPKDAYIYEMDSDAPVKWGFHCSHDTCQAARRRIAGVFDRIKASDESLIKACQSPWPNLAEQFDTIPDEEEPADAPEAAEQCELIGSGDLLAQPPTELANADLFVMMHAKKVRYLHDEQQWLLWQPQGWTDDTTEQVREKAKQITRLRIDKAATPDMIEAAAKFGTAKAIDGTLKTARSVPGIAASSENFDVNPWLIGCKNGLLNLQTGVITPARPCDMVRCLANVNYRPEATCPRWLQHLQEVHPRHPEISRFLQIWFGYCLTGMVSEEKILIFYGTGKNGKSTIVDTFHELMGQYAGVAAKSLLLANPRGDDPKAATPALVDLKGKRMVTLSETDVDAKISEASIKEVTKGEPITARRLHGNNVTFRSRAKIILSSNHRPKVCGTDEGIWRRLALVKFDENFEGREDGTLKEVVLSEIEGIFAWAVQGCMKWQEEGLVLPQVIKDDTALYRKEEDLMGQFVEENMVVRPDGRSGRKETYVRYQEWAHQSGLKSLSRPKFNKKMEDKGFGSVSIAGYPHWVGLELKDETLCE